MAQVHTLDIDENGGVPVPQFCDLTNAITRLRPGRVRVIIERVGDEPGRVRVIIERVGDEPARSTMDDLISRYEAENAIKALPCNADKVDAFEAVLKVRAAARSPPGPGYYMVNEHGHWNKVTPSDVPLPGETVKNLRKDLLALLSDDGLIGLEKGPRHVQEKAKVMVNRLFDRYFPANEEKEVD